MWSLRLKKSALRIGVNIFVICKREGENFREFVSEYKDPKEVFGSSTS